MEMNAIAPPPDLDLKTAHWRHMFASVPTTQESISWRQQMQQHCRTPISVALGIALLTLLLLLLLSPPFVQARTDEELERGKPDPKRLLGWALLVGVVVLFLPLLTGSTA